MNHATNEYYNHATNEYTNTPGVEIRVPGFGRTTTVADLASGASDDDTKPAFPYMYNLINFFVNRGYNDSKIRAAPYDWRLSAGLACNNYAYCIAGYFHVDLIFERLVRVEN